MKSKIYGKIYICYFEPISEENYDPYDSRSMFVFDLKYAKNKYEKIEAYEGTIKNLTNNLNKLKTITLDDYISQQFYRRNIFESWKVKKEIEYPYQLIKGESFEGYEIEKVNYMENGTVEYYIDESLEIIDESNEKKEKWFNDYKEKVYNKTIPEIESYLKQLQEDLNKLNKKRFWIFG